LAGLRNDTSGREQLAKSEAQLLQIIDAIPQMITVLTPAGDALYVNRAMLDYTGLTIEEVMAADFVRESFTRRTLRVSTMSAEMHCSMSYRLQLKKGSWAMTGSTAGFPCNTIR